MARPVTFNLVVDSGLVQSYDSDFLLGSDLPASGVVPGEYVAPVLSIDATGRITSATQSVASGGDLVVVYGTLTFYYDRNASGVSAAGDLYYDGAASLQFADTDLRGRVVNAVGLGELNSVIKLADAGNPANYVILRRTATPFGTPLGGVTVFTETVSVLQSSGTLPATGRVVIDYVTLGGPRLAAANTFTPGPQTVRTGGDANKGLVARANSSSQTANLVEAEDENAAARVFMSPGAAASADADGYYLGFTPAGGREYRIGTYDGGGRMVFARSDNSTSYFSLQLDSGQVTFSIRSGLIYILGTQASPGLVITPYEAGGTGVLQIGRRVSDSNAAVGASVELWPNTGQTAALLGFMAPGGASTNARFNANGSWTPPHVADAAAANDTVYYSTTAGKLVYKDGAGVVNNLY